MTQRWCSAESSLNGTSIGTSRALQNFFKSLWHSALMPVRHGLTAPCGQRERAVGNGEVVVNRDGAAKAFAGRARAERMVETEQGRGWLAVFEVAGGAVQAVAEKARGWRMEDARMEFPNRQFAFAEMVGLFAGFDETGAGGGRELEAVLNDRECGMRSAECGMAGRVVQRARLRRSAAAAGSLAWQSARGFVQRELLRERQVERDQDFVLGESPDEPFRLRVGSRRRSPH